MFRAPHPFRVFSLASFRLISFKYVDFFTKRNFIFHRFPHICCEIWIVNKFVIFIIPTIIFPDINWWVSFICNPFHNLAPCCRRLYAASSKSIREDFKTAISLFCLPFTPFVQLMNEAVDANMSLINSSSVCLLSVTFMTLLNKAESLVNPLSKSFEMVRTIAWRIFSLPLPFSLCGSWLIFRLPVK